MKLNRNYLTSDELVGIVNELVQHESAVEREIIKVGMVAQCLIEEMDEYKDCNAMYDAIMENGIDLDFEVNNYYMIDRLVDKELGVDTTVRVFLESLNSKLQGFDLNNSIEQLKGVMGSANK